MQPAFEIWFYRGLIGFLFIVIWWYWQRQVEKQDDINEKFFKLFETTENAVTRLTTLLEGRDELCKEKHTTVNQRIRDLEGKK